MPMTLTVALAVFGFFAGRALRLWEQERRLTMIERSELADFAALVKSMRDAQRRFFKGDRSPAAIRDAMDLERRVDESIRVIGGERQGALFGRDERNGAYGH